MRKSILLCLGTILFLLSTSFAQDAPKVEVFGGYSYLNADEEGFVPRQHFHGFDTNATFYVDEHFGIEGDFAAQFQSDCLGLSSLLNDTTGLTSGVGCHYMQFMAGPKAAFRKGKLTVFGHALFGGNNIVISTSALDIKVSISQVKWAMAAGGGVDWEVSPRYSIRLGQADYLLTNHGAAGFGTHQNNFRISAGIVFKFGGFPQRRAKAHGLSAPSTPSTGPARFDTLGIAVQPAVNGTGLEITEIAPNGAAAKAGLGRQDVIATVNGRDVRTVEDMKAVLDAGKDHRLVVRYLYLGTPQYRTVEINY